MDPSLYIPILEIAREAYSRSKDRQAAIDATTDLLLLRIASDTGLIPVSDFSADQDLQSALSLVPESGSLIDRSLWKMVAALPHAPFSFRLPGEAYQYLMEESFEEEEAGGKVRRRQGGVFFTPEPIIERILSLAGTPGDATQTVCDPAMGSGHFLLQLVKEVLRLHGLEKARLFASNYLFGIDLDPASSRLARQVLSLVLSAPDDLYQVPEGHYICDDSLLSDLPSDWPSYFAAVVGNPPYDVLTNFKTFPDRKEYAAALRNSGRYELALSGQINLYRCFIERGLQILAPEGCLSLVVPAGLMRDKTAAPLRKALIEDHGADVFELYRERDRVFEGVTQAVTIFRAYRHRGTPESVQVGTPAEGRPVASTTLKAFSDTWVLPDASEEDWDLLRWLLEHAPDQFQSIAEGAVGEVDQTVYRPAMKDQDTGHLLVRGCHLQTCRVDLGEKVLKERWLDQEEFVARKGDSAPACLTRVGRGRVIQLGIRNMDSHPRLVAARLKPGIFAGNSLNVWYPRQAGTLLLLTGLLNCRLYDWRFTMTSGNNNINVHEVQTLPLPSALDPKRIKSVESAVKSMEQNARTGTDLRLARSSLDETVYDLFRLPERFRKHLLSG